jgi:hypothetical protein
MSETNGILRIGNKGTLTIAIGDENDPRHLKPVTVDVIRVQNAWGAIYRTFLNDDKQIPPERWVEYQNTLEQFICGVMQVDVGKLTGAECLEVLAGVAREEEKLRRFFEVTSPAEPSSAGRTAVTFSQ